MKTPRPRRRFLRLERLEDRAVPATYHWVGGQSLNSWFAQNNWDLGQIPGAGDTAVLDPGTPAANLVNLLGQPTSVQVEKLVLAPGYLGTLSLSGVSLTMTSEFSIADGTIDGQGGTLKIDNTANGCTVAWIVGTIQNATFQVGVQGGAATTFTWNGGTGSNLLVQLSEDVTTNVSTGPNSSNDVRLQDSLLKNYGTLRQTQGMRIEGSVANATTVENYGTWELAAAVNLRGSNPLAGPVVVTTFDNYGIFRQSSGGTSRIFLDFNNHVGASVQVEAVGGTLELKGKGTQEGVFSVSNGATLDFEKWTVLNPFGGVNTFKPTAAVLGPGTVEIRRGSQLVVDNGTSLTVNSLLLNNDGSVGGDLSMLVVNGEITINTMTWDSGRVAGTAAGRLTLAAGGTMEIPTSDRKDLYTVTLLVFGTIHWRDGEFYMADRANLIVEAGGQFLLQTTESITVDVPAGAPPGTPRPTIFVRPNGLMENTVGALPPEINAAIKNIGGTVRFKQGWIALGTDYEQTAGLTEFDQATVSVTGKFKETGGSVNLINASLDATGKVIEEGGYFSIDHSTVTTTAGLDISAGAYFTGTGMITANVTTAGGVVAYEIDVTGKYTQTGGITEVWQEFLAVTGQVLQEGGDFVLYDASLTAAGDLLIVPGARLYGNGSIIGNVFTAGEVTTGTPGPWPVPGDITVEGDYTQTGGSTTPRGSLGVTGTFALGGGTFFGGEVVTLDLGAFHQTGGLLVMTFANLQVDGDFLVEGGTARIHYCEGSISGQMLVQGGEVSLGDFDSITVSGGVSIGAGGWLGLYNGTLIANVTNAGTLSLTRSGAGNDLSTIDGNFTQTSTGGLVMQARPNMQDHLSISGLATFDGSFGLGGIDGFDPGVGESFQLIDAGGVSGEFAAVGLPLLTYGEWVWDYAGGFTVSVVEP